MQKERTNAKKAYEFRDEQEIVNRLRKKRAACKRFFERREDDLEKVVYHSVGPSTLRGLPNNREDPTEIIRSSVVFRIWGVDQCENWHYTGKLYSITTQDYFDDWLVDPMIRLRMTWKKQMGYELNFGQAMKLINLLLKGFVSWTEIDNLQRRKLIKFLNVPLEEYVLVGIRNCVSDLEIKKIPKKPTMSYVPDWKTYTLLQERIRQIAGKANVPAIYFDFVAWNSRHPRFYLTHTE